MPHEPRSPLAVANEFLRVARERQAPLDHMKLQKLAFYAHGWHLGLRHRPLLDEEVEAWPYGPVIPTIYHALKRYGTEPVSADISDIDATGRAFTPELPEGYDRELCETVWNKYGSLTATQLSKLTHRVGTPWYITWKRNTDGLRSITIPNDVIEAYFSEQADKNRGSIVRS
jgi:uncharacterized phage-associated protein